MQIIIILLVIIIFILAPWTIVAAAGIAATYGIYIVAFTGLVGVAAVVMLLKRRSSSGSSSSMRSAIRAANVESKRKSDLAWTGSQPDGGDELPPSVKPARQDIPETLRVCSSCQVEVLPGKANCSSCGRHVA